jgi:hypothetical protein
MPGTSARSVRIHSCCRTNDAAGRVHNVEASGREVGGGQVGIERDQPRGVQRREEAGVGVQRGNAASRADAVRGDGGGAGGGPCIEAVPGGGEPEPLA